MKLNKTVSALLQQRDKDHKLSIESAIAKDRRDHGVKEKWQEFDILYRAPSGNVWLTWSQAEAIRKAGKELPTGYNIPDFDLISLQTANSPVIYPSNPGK